MRSPNDRRLPRWVVALVGCVPLAVVACGCSVTKQPPATAVTPTASPVTQPPPAPVVPAPSVGGCHLLTFESAAHVSDDAPAVPCSSRHTSQTYYVGPLNSTMDGHALAVNTVQVQRRIAASCRSRLGAYLGGGKAGQARSVFRSVGFSPSRHEAAQGAGWFRCDVVAVQQPGTLLPLPPRVRRVLTRRSGLARFGQCGRTAPNHPGFAAVACSQPHRWREVSVIGLPRSAPYLGKRAGAAALARCRAVARARSGGSLSYSWTFVWPTRQEWASGARLGGCWTPDRR